MSYLVSPNGLVDVVEFDVYGRERKEASNKELDFLPPVERNGRDLAHKVGNAGGRVEVRGESLSCNSSDDGEREAHEEPDDENHSDRAHRDLGGGSVVPGDHIDNLSNHEHWESEESGGEDDIPVPASPLHFCEHGGRDEAREDASECVEDHSHRLAQSHPVQVEHPADSAQKHSERDEEELHPNSQERGKNALVLWNSEHVSMQKLPSIILLSSFFWENMMKEDFRKSESGICLLVLLRPSCCTSRSLP